MSEARQVNGLSAWAYDEALRCTGCGFCLQACPTYLQLGTETASPRGRLNLVRAVAEGSLPLNGDFADPMNLCLGCRACEPVCPSGVQYAMVLEAARDALEQTMGPKRSWGERLARWIGFRWLLPNGRLLRAGMALLGILQRTGLIRPLSRLFPRHLRPLLAALPPAPTSLERQKWDSMFEQLPDGAGLVARAEGNQKYRVLFLPGCVMDGLFLPVNLATVRVLRRAGCEVVVPAQIGCCGALHAHSGRMAEARSLAIKNVQALADVGRVTGEIDAIINNAGGCGAHLREYGHLLSDHPEAASFSDRCREISEWLVEIGAEGLAWKPLDLTVTYQESCHLANGQRVTEQPRRLLKSIPGLHFTEMDNASRCCGSAGIYNILQPEMAAALLAEKIDAINQAGAPIVVTGNPGCHLQLLAGLQSCGQTGQTKVMHIVELLDLASDASNR